jgi:hypothetical protein
MTQHQTTPRKPAGHAGVKYVFAFIWAVIGPSYAWEMWHGGQDLRHPLNAAVLTLAIAGPIAAFLGPRMRLVSSLAGISLASISTYFSWPIWFFDLGADTTIILHFWGLEFVNRAAQIWSLVHVGTLMIFSFISAYFAAAELDKSKPDKHPPSVSHP